MKVIWKQLHKRMKKKKSNFPGPLLKIITQSQLTWCEMKHDNGPISTNMPTWKVVKIPNERWQSKVIEKVAFLRLITTCKSPHLVYSLKVKITTGFYLNLLSMNFSRLILKNCLKMQGNIMNWEKERKGENYQRLMKVVIKFHIFHI